MIDGFFEKLNLVVPRQLIIIKIKGGFFECGKRRYDSMERGLIKNQSAGLAKRIWMLVRWDCRSEWYKLAQALLHSISSSLLRSSGSVVPDRA